MYVYQLISHKVDKKEVDDTHVEYVIIKKRVLLEWRTFSHVDKIVVEHTDKYRFSTIYVYVTMHETYSRN